MRTFARKQHQPQARVLVNLAQSNKASFDTHHQTMPIPHAHSAIDNQALEPMSQAPAEELVAGPRTAAAHFAFDFSRVPITTAIVPQRQPDFTRLPATPQVQRKPAISSPGDAYEREADEAADKVMRMVQPAPIHSTGEAINRKCAACEDEEEKRIQTKPAPAAHTDAALDAGAAASAIGRGGTPLSSEVRAYFEPRFGYDFSRVRVHADAEAAHGAHAIRARAYTIGPDIAFASGEYAPATTAGKRLLAHELAHVVQQGHVRSLTHGFIKNEAAPMNNPLVSAYHPALDEAAVQKQSDRARLWVRSIGESPAVISRQKTGPDASSGKQSKAGNKREDLKKLLKDPCFGESVDDAKAHCQFSSTQSTMVRLVMQSALRTCTRAIAAVDMPGNEDWVMKIAQDYFHGVIKLTEKNRRAIIGKIKAISDKLEHAPIECRTCQDENCNQGFIAFAEGRTVLAICPPFFHSEIYKPGLTPRFLIHEAAHLAGINKPSRDELYCHMGATKEDKCPVVDGLHNADAWSHFIEDLAAAI